MTSLRAPNGSNPFEVGQSTHGHGEVNSKFALKLFCACALLGLCSLFVLYASETDLSPKNDKTRFRLNTLAEVLKSYQGDLETASGFVSLDVLLSQAVFDERMSPWEPEILQFDGWGDKISLTMKKKPEGLRFRLQSNGPRRDPITKFVVLSE